MRTCLALLLALTTGSTALAEEAKPKPAPVAPGKVKPKATDASVTALRNRLTKARDELRAAIAAPRQKVNAADQKRYDAMVSEVRAMADAADAVAAKITEGLKNIRDSRDGLAEMGEEQQLRMQMVVERMTKADSAASNVLKKFAEQISQIIANMK